MTGLPGAPPGPSGESASWPAMVLPGRAARGMAESEKGGVGEGAWKGAWKGVRKSGWKCVWESRKKRMDGQ